MTDSATMPLPFETKCFSTKERRNASFQSIEGTGYIASKTARIKKFLRNNPLSTSREIWLGTGIERTSICGRLREMAKRGEVDTNGEKYDLKTEEYVTAYRVIEP